MTRFFKSAAFPIIIVIVLAFFASKLISGNDRAEKTTFSQFLTQIDSKPTVVKSVTLDTKDNSVEVTKTDGKKYEVGYPADYADVLINQLKASESDGIIQGFDVRPARSSVSRRTQRPHRTAPAGHRRTKEMRRAPRTKPQHSGCSDGFGSAGYSPPEC